MSEKRCRGPEDLCGGCVECDSDVAEIALLREALERIASIERRSRAGGGLPKAREIARAALGASEATGERE